jgi:hypothetical protein
MQLGRRNCGDMRGEALRFEHPSQDAAACKVYPGKLLQPRDRYGDIYALHATISWQPRSDPCFSAFRGNLARPGILLH